MTKVALVTGSGKKRVGWHVAQALAGRGYALAIHYHQSIDDGHATVQQLKARGVQALGVQADLTEEAAVQSAVATVLKEFGRIDVLVNSAAIWPRKRLEETTAADVRHAFDANVLGTFLCAQQAGLAMVKQPEGGAIINLGDWAIERPYLDHAAYFIAKGTIPTLTRCLAVELATRNPKVRVNCIHPGPVMLPPNLTDAERTAAIRGTLVQREGTPEHVAQAVLSLIDNDYITGTCLNVDGGRAIFAPD